MKPKQNENFVSLCMDWFLFLFEGGSFTSSGSVLLPFCTVCPTLWPDPCSVQTETAACPSFSRGRTALWAVSVGDRPAKQSEKQNQ